MTKTCSNPKCLKEKPLSEFYKHSSHKDGLMSQCKKCRDKISRIFQKTNKEQIAKYQKEYRDKNREKFQKYRKKRNLQNSEKNKEYQKTYQRKNAKQIKLSSNQKYNENKKSILQQQKEYYEKNKEQIKNRVKKYNSKNREKINKHRQQKLKINVHYKIKQNLRSRLHSALKGNTKSKRTLELLGCTVEKLKQHLESQFANGMTWDNHSSLGWHIDHIRPCASFDLSKPEEQNKCFNYSNLQPLWATENLKKGSR